MSSMLFAILGAIESALICYVPVPFTLPYDVTRPETKPQPLEPCDPLRAVIGAIPGIVFGVGAGLAVQPTFSGEAGILAGGLASMAAGKLAGMATLKFQVSGKNASRA